MAAPIAHNDIPKGSKYELSVGPGPCQGKCTNFAKVLYPDGTQQTWEHSEIRPGPRKLSLDQEGTYTIDVTAEFDPAALPTDCCEVTSEVVGIEQKKRKLVNNTLRADTTRISIEVV